MRESDIKLLEENGWIVVCESPFELEDGDGAGTATGSGADFILEMLKLFEKGFNVSEIGRKFNIDRRQVSDIKRGRRWGHVGDRSKIKQIAPNKKVLDIERVVEIKKLYLSGLRVVDLCNKFNINRSTIGDIIKNITWKHVKI